MPLGCAHNDLQPSNIIVQDGRIVDVKDFLMTMRLEFIHWMCCPGSSAYERA